MIVFWTPESAQSDEVFIEVNYAIRHRKKIVQVFLEDTRVPNRIEFMIGHESYVKRWELHDNEFLAALAGIIPESCKRPQLMAAE